MQKHLGAFLRELRTEKHLTQTQVAQELGTTRQAYAYYENSASIPDMESLTCLAGLYAIPLESFLVYLPGRQPDVVCEPGGYRTASYKQTIYPQFMEYYSRQENMKKYHYLNRPEKELLFLFQKLDEASQEELVLFTYLKTLVSQPQK